MRIISEKDGVLKENGALKDLQIENSRLKEENRKLRQNIANNSPTQSTNSSQDDIEFALPDRSSPDGEELETACTDTTALKPYKETEDVKEEQIRLGWKF